MKISSANLLVGFKGVFKKIPEQRKSWSETQQIDTFESSIKRETHYHTLYGDDKKISQEYIYKNGMLDGRVLYGEISTCGYFANPKHTYIKYDGTSNKPTDSNWLFKISKLINEDVLDDAPWHKETTNIDVGYVLSKPDSTQLEVSQNYKDKSYHFTFYSPNKRNEEILILQDGKIQNSVSPKSCLNFKELLEEFKSIINEPDFELKEKMVLDGWNFNFSDFDELNKKIDEAILLLDDEFDYFRPILTGEDRQRNISIADLCIGKPAKRKNK